MIARVALALSIALVAVSPAAFAGHKAKGHKKSGHKYAHASGKTCKKEFMYLKGGKCEDARKKKPA